MFNRLTGETCVSRAKDYPARVSVAAAIFPVVLDHKDIDGNLITNEDVSQMSSSKESEHNKK